MRAVIYEQFGSPEVLRLQDIPKPVPQDGEVLVRVHAASVNSWDWDLLRGKPFLTRLVGGGLLAPRYPVLGADIAGRVEATGSGVQRLKPGDAVFGDLSGCGWGGFADYVCAPDNMLARKPEAMTFVQAAAIPQAALLALQALRDKKPIRPGDRVLINGAGGGVGTFAIQLAKRYGAHVTGVDSGEKLETMRAVGANQVIDFAQTDFTGTGERFDFILDVVASRPLSHYARALKPGGAFVLVGGTTPTILRTALFGSLRSKLGSRRFTILAWHTSVADLEEMCGLFETGEVTPVVDRIFPLEETADALAYLGAARARGKVVVTVADDGAPEKT